MARTGNPSLVHLDTHAVCWLYNGEPKQLSRAALAAIEVASIIAISPLVELELHFLVEIGRFRDPPAQVLQALFEKLGMTISHTALRDVTTAAHGLNWTRDPFDRLIAAQAICDNAVLVTKDRTIRQHCPNALW